ncbi:MAG: RNA methyltransferase [Pyrinomonadaceae bacterium]|nr:RNA methyltransferase [Pyrinomonadaceae bacterium]MCX7640236.1 RNA methyltransferase [Pyrinomonadaceae bacterium]MDW8305140.1 RNA methyltransferase [Acidobacteriota bacterium]
MLKVSSKDNPKIKLLQAVRKGLNRDYVFVEGLKLCEEAVVSSKLDIYGVFFSEDFAESEKGKRFLELAKGKLLVEVANKLFKKISDTKSTQGVVVLCHRLKGGKELLEEKIKTSSVSVVVFPNRISNPLNLGAILRIVRAVDASGIVLTKGSTDAFSPKAVRSSAGACLHTAVWNANDFHEVVSWAKEKGLKTICADAEAEKSYRQVDWSRPSLLIFGSEGQGLTEEELGLVEERIKIPMRNGVESLNIAVACGLILYQASGL